MQHYLAHMLDTIAAVNETRISSGAGLQTGSFFYSTNLGNNL
jgi:hypothetical protein